MNHTPEPWTAKRRSFNYGCYGHEITVPDHVANLSTVQHTTTIATVATDDDRDRANVARIVSCVNACNGIEDPAAALAKVRELLDRIGHAHDYSDARDMGVRELAVEALKLLNSKLSET